MTAQDALFGRLASWHGLSPWGRFLDAGTGDHSLQWILGLETSAWTAVTGAPDRAAGMRQRFARRIRPQDQIVAGNWSDPSFLEGQVFDVVLADYLIGALEGFAPYFQDKILPRLRPHVSQALYVVGLDPFPPRAKTDGGALIVEIARLRDACILMAGHQCYREYPMEWVSRHLEIAGFEVERQERMPILYGDRFIKGQLAVARRKLPYFKDKALAQSMGRHIDTLQARALEHLGRHGRIRFGADYTIKARPV